MLLFYSNNSKLNFFTNLFKSKDTLKSDILTLLETKINYRFTNRKYLKIALTHRSLSSNPENNYERLEFLGDAILDYVVSEWLFNKYKFDDEGKLTKRRASLVNRIFLAMLGQDFGLTDYLFADSGVDIKDSKVNLNISADIYESLIGAIFLDGGETAATDFIKRSLVLHEDRADLNQNYKGTLIELCHQMSLGSPQFQLEKFKGPEHDKIFMVRVLLENGQYYSGSGSSKKSAEQNAAKKALDTLSVSV